ncbi:hypothetical protein [Tomitella biformata]|uniref:hypothetical protein n=1 Tax=Tomitella biformata TaxID=630403 RepID=UPI0004675063|nr:hypothetical protein [Tomitella biformata]
MGNAGINNVGGAWDGASLLPQMEDIMTNAVNPNACLPRCSADHVIDQFAADGVRRCTIHARPVVGRGGESVTPWAERSIAGGGAAAQRRVWLGVGERHMSIVEARSYALELLRMVGDLTADEVATGIPTVADLPSEGQLPDRLTA